MTASNLYLPAITANLTALQAIVTAALVDIGHGLEAAGQGNRNGAAGATILADEQLKRAAILTQAIIMLHRQS